MDTEKKTTTSAESNTLTLEEGMKRTNNWREAVKGLFGDDYDRIPRGFYIKMEDITDLSEKYKKFGATGVRAYFTLNEPLTPETDGVCGILVPVIQVIEGDEVLYKDLIIPVPKENGAEEGEEQVSIYDLTRPCPVFCDKSSLLY